MTYPSGFTGASKTPTQRTPACTLGTEWPKVLSQDSADTAAGSLTNTHNVFLGMSVEINTGNIIMCGWSNMPVHETKLYVIPEGSIGTNKKAIIFLLNTVGDIMWHYTFKQVKTPMTTDVSAQHCRFSHTANSIYTLLHDTADHQLSLMKQTYE